MNKKLIHIQKIKAEALSRINSNNLPEARKLYQKVCRLDKHDAEAWFTLAGINGRLGAFDDAASCCRHVISLRPSFFQAYDILGSTLKEAGKIDQAITCYRKALEINPDYIAANYNLGNALAERGDIDGAEQCYRKALQNNPDFPNANNNLGNIFLKKNAYQEAEYYFNRAIAANPGYAEAHANLGQALHHLNRHEEALTSLKQALKHSPGDAQSHFHIGLVLRDIGRFQEAEKSLRQAVKLKPDFAEAYNLLGEILFIQGNYDESEKAYQTELGLRPDETEAITGMCAVYEKQGNHDKAYDLLAPLLANDPENHKVAYAFGLLSQHLNRRKEAVTLLEKVSHQPGLENIESQRLQFMLGKLYDREGDFENAFIHYERGNQLKPFAFNAAAYAAEFGETTSVFSKDFLQSSPRAQSSTACPIFVVGMPRSGTSLVEQILASHPAVYGAGEIREIISLTELLPGILKTGMPYPSCLTSVSQETVDVLAQTYLEKVAAVSDDAQYFTDKMPHNFMHLGLIELLLPNARIIHCVREPLDTCLSCYFQDFGARHTYSNKLYDLGLAYALYERLMQHWHEVLTLPILDVQYEELVADQEGVSRRMVELCGLPWDDRCLKYHQSRRYVMTASYDQVRKPIYQGSVGRWRHYEHHLQALRDGLEKGRHPENTTQADFD